MKARLTTNPGGWWRLALLALTLTLLACEEIPPVLSPLDPGGDTTLTGQQRHVLIEEFTGVRCVNCPRGSQAIQDLQASYGDRLVAVNIHAGFFSPPYDSSRYDFRTEAGTGILNALGAPLGYPTAVINRRRFPGEERLQTGLATWPGYVAEEMRKPPAAALALNLDYEAASRQLLVTLSVRALEPLAAQSTRLNVWLTEDNITDWQLTPTGWDEDYVHHDVFRAALTPILGQPLRADLAAGAMTTTYTYSYRLPEAYRAEATSIVAFLHQDGADNRQVLQAVRRSLAD